MGRAPAMQKSRLSRHKGGSLHLMSFRQLVILDIFRTYRPDPSCRTAVLCTEEAGSAPSITELGHRGSLCPEDSLERVQPHTHSSRHPHAAGRLSGERGWLAKFTSSLHPGPRDDAQQVHLPCVPECQCQTHLVSPHSN